MTTLIIDPQGVWLRSNAAFPLNGPEKKKTNKHLFIPRQVVKILRSNWAKC